MIETVRGRGACDVLLAGPLPPPMNGMTVMTAYALDASKGRAICMRHFDISDHRHVSSMGRLDLPNVLLALSQAARLYRTTRVLNPRFVVLPIAQSSLGFIRDAALFLAVWCGGAKSLVYLHGAAFNEFRSKASPLMRWVIRACFRTAWGAFVLTPSARSIFGSLMQLERVWVVPNGIPGAPPILGVKAGQGNVNVLFLSNLFRGKGYLDALMAAVVVARTRGKIHFIFAGAWPRRDEERSARDVVRRYGLQDRVEFRGQVVGLRKIQLLDTTDILCFTPRFPEGQPVVLLEAMRHSVPCVATPQGGIVDTMVDGVTGILVKTGDAESIAEGILKLAGDSTLRERMGAAARRRYEEKFTERHYGASLMTSLNAAISGLPSKNRAAAGRGGSG